MNAASRRRTMLYITPVVPADTGNGLAMRAASVLRRLARDHDVSLLSIPLYPPGPGQTGDTLPEWVHHECVAARRLDTENPAYPGERFDIVHVYRLASVPHARPYVTMAAEWHLDLDDVESRTFARIAKLALQPASQQAIARAARQEEHVLHTWQRVYVCSDVDRSWLLATHPATSADVVVLPNVVALPPDPPASRHQPPITFLFVGTLAYAPNADGIVWFCREVLPTIRELTPVPVKVCIVGVGASDEVRQLEHIPEVQYVGPVDRLDEWYVQADIVIAPLRAGGGTRIKILEALAHRRPVVSTTIGAEGLSLHDETHLLIADRPRHFAEHCLRLIGDAALAHRLADDGHAAVATSVRQFWSVDEP